MIFYFEIPQATNTVKLLELFEPKSLSPQEQTLIHKVDEDRKQFYQLLKLEKIKELLELQDSLINYENLYQAYLKETIQALEIVRNKKCANILYSYTTFISKNKNNFDTKTSTNNQQSSSVEILMSKYAYAFAYQIMPMNFLQSYYGLIEKSLTNANFNEKDLLKTQINTILRTWAYGYVQIKKTIPVATSLLHFIVQVEGTLNPECKQTVLHCVMNILTINSNGLHCEVLRLDKNYEKLHRLCKTTAQLVQTTRMRLTEIQEEILKDYLDFMTSASYFFRAYAYWAYINRLQDLINAEQYGNSTFTELSLKCLSLSQEINNIIASYKQAPVQADYYAQGLSHMNNLFAPLAKQMITRYAGIYQKQHSLQNPVEIYNSFGLEQNYYDTDEWVSSRLQN